MEETLRVHRNTMKIANHNLKKHVDGLADELRGYKEYEKYQESRHSE